MRPLAKGVVLALLIIVGATSIAQRIDNETSVSLGTGMTVFGLSFAAWAALLGWVIFVLRREFAELRLSVREETERRRQADERAHQDRLQIERRLTEIEANWRNHASPPHKPLRGRD